MTEAGLNTVNLSQMTAFQQVLLWVLILMGSAIFVSVGTVLTRKRVFEKRFDYVVKAQREARRVRRRSMSQLREVPVTERLQMQRKVEEPADDSGFESRHSGPRDPTNGPFEGGSGREKPNLGAVRESEETEVEDRKSVDHELAYLDKSEYEMRGGISTSRGEGIHERKGRIPTPEGPILHYAPPASPTQSSHRFVNFAGVGAHPNASSSAHQLSYSPNSVTQRGRSESALAGDISQHSLHSLHYPSYLTEITIGRNSSFHGLSKDEREHLGGVEYRAITLLAYIVPIYFVLWQLLGCLGLGAYMAHNKANVAERNGINPW